MLRHVTQAEVRSPKLPWLRQLGLAPRPRCSAVAPSAHNLVRGVTFSETVCKFARARLHSNNDT